MSQIDTFEAMLARGQDGEMLRYTLGNAYFADKQFEPAITHLQQAVKIKPDYSAAWRVLGRALAANEQLNEAKQAFDQGAQVAEANGDKQTAKEINVFRKRVIKAIEAAAQTAASASASTDSQVVADVQLAVQTTTKDPAQ